MVMTIRLIEHLREAQRLALTLAKELGMPEEEFIEWWGDAERMKHATRIRSSLESWQKCKEHDVDFHVRYEVHQHLTELGQMCMTLEQERAPASPSMILAAFPPMTLNA
jgi:hypothetical protein